ncbi:MAG: hypothetical protein HC912_09300 [Saprospiraceae bacterium]|nr:hypothetical protein [Saprospiraceae bacterium]
MLQELDEIYLNKLEAIAQEIQVSEELVKYLETEEEGDYNLLKEMYEPKIAIVHEDIANKFPLQLVHMEKVLMHEAFEGLFMPKILGYSVLRGEVSAQYKYIIPQEHFADSIRAICNSSNFEILKQRVGQSLQIGFGLSSDIWITNLINEFENKRIRNYLISNKLAKYRIDDERRIALARFRLQFRSDNYQSAEFPETLAELKIMFSALKNFLIYRIDKKYDNKSLVDSILQFIRNEEFTGTDEHLQMLVLFSSSFELKGDILEEIKALFQHLRTEKPNFIQQYFAFLLELHKHPSQLLNAKADLSMSAIINKSQEDVLSEYYQLMDIIHTKGYIHSEVQEAVKLFDNKHMGRSLEVEAVRRTIFAYLKPFIQNLEVGDYAEYMDIVETFRKYMHIFANQQFNQDLKDISMVYLKKLMKHYTDKRGKDYQDIKKFVVNNFPTLGFLKEKEIVELFKTKKKKKVEA